MGCSVAEAGSRRRTFWPTVLAGVVGSGLAAMGGSKDWFAAANQSAAALSGLGTTSALDAPAVTALGLVALAAWGVVLVTRGWVRRGVAVLGALAGAGAVAAGIVSLGDAPHGTHSSGAWPWLGLVGAVLATVAAVAAVMMAPAWPEMGRKYDAPTGAAQAATLGPEDLGEADNIDLWKSITEGRDPTLDGDE